MSADYRVPAVESTARVLAALMEADACLQSELCERTGISKSTMHNLVTTLEAVGYARRDPDTRRWRLGGGLIALGAAAERDAHAISLAASRLEPIADAEGVSAAVAAVLPGGQAQITHRAYPGDSVHVGVRVGSRYGYFDGAIGKCLLAALTPERARSVVLGQPIPAHTERTVTEPDSLLEELDGVRERGWAASVGEFNSNNAVAAPIYGGDGRPEALLLALGFAGDLDEERIPEVGDALVAEGLVITEHIGGRVPQRETVAAGARTKRNRGG